MTSSVIAAQLFTLREFCKTASDFAASMKKVRKIGYEAVQVSGIGPIDPNDVAKILADEQLTCCITHTGLDDLRNNFDAVVARHKLWQCPYTALGGLFPQEVFTRQLWQNFIDEFYPLCKRYAAAGLAVGYHNHSHEFVKVDGTTPMQMIVDQVKAPAIIELDTYWVAHGGADPIEWINKCTGRLPCLHLKDIAITQAKEHKMMPVGEGNLNVPGIIAAATRAGTRWFIVEQDNCNGLDPFDCLATSFRNLQAMGLR